MAREPPVRTADRDELTAVMNVLDGALLATDATSVANRIADGDVLVAVDGRHIVGACVLDAVGACRVEAIAVRRSRRGQGIGSQLIRTAAARYDGIVAEFDADVRPFWLSLGFELTPAEEPGRYVGTLEATPP